ncbi:MAG TPA: hypothetical protein VFP32_01000 [Candidatus Saccharimonadales bacterium]|nr:hypothetical protein [Candidatus Saccharimonadales bacterium]
MRKIVGYVLALILVGGAAALIIIAVNNGRGHNDAALDTSSVQSAPAHKKACDIFTLADAKKLLGDNAKGGQSTPDKSSSDLSVSTCSYTADSGSNAPVSSNNSASLTVRTPSSSAGTQVGQKEFDYPPAPQDQKVTGYGDDAYWDAQTGQLNILKNNIWYVLSYGPATPADRTLTQTEQLANLLTGKL